MPPPVNLERQRAKIEQMEVGDGSLLDTIAGAIVRIFVRLNQLEEAERRLVATVKRLEDAIVERSDAPARADAAPKPNGGGRGENWVSKAR